MYQFSLRPKFYIIFTLVTLTPAMWIGGLFQTLISQSSAEIIRQFAAWGIIQAPTAIALIGALFWIYKTYLWHVWPFSYLHKLAYIAGRYEGEAESSFDENKHPVILEIEQTLLSIKVRLYTPRSTSFSLIAAVGENEQGNQCLTYGYKNTPRTVSTDLDMRSHDGFASLEIFPIEHRLGGFYFNDPRERGRHGKLSCIWKESKLRGHL